MTDTRQDTEHTAQHGEHGEHGEHGVALRVPSTPVR